MEYNKERVEKPDGSGFYEIFIRSVSGGHFQRVTREFIYKTVTSKIPTSVVERRKWKKFGDATDANQHITTYGQEVFIEIPSTLTNYHYNDTSRHCVNFWDGSIVDICNKSTGEFKEIKKPEVQEPSKEEHQKNMLETELLGERAETLESEKLVQSNQPTTINKDSNENESVENTTNSKGMCRHCQENHWSFSCPTNRQNQPREERKREPREHRENNSRWKPRDKNEDNSQGRNYREKRQEKPRGDYRTKGQRTLKIMNLPEDAEYRELMDYFKYYGDIEHLKMIHNKETKEFIGMVILTYVNIDSANMALSELDGYRYQYSIINVSLADEN